MLLTYFVFEKKTIKEAIQAQLEINLERLRLRRLYSLELRVTRLWRKP